MRIYLLTDISSNSLSYVDKKSVLPMDVGKVLRLFWEVGTLEDMFDFL